MARISQDEINRVKSTVSLLDWVRGQGYEVSRQGKDYAVLCPFHEEKTPSMMIHPTKNVYHCFTKSLATLGEGDITVREDADTGENSLASLNRDLDKTEKELFSSESGMSVDATIDIRLFSESGRDQIAEDILKTGMMVDAVEQIIKKPLMVAQ